MRKRGTGRIACPLLVLLLASLCPAAYVGVEVCATCHEDKAAAFKSNPHHVVAQACESCHGQGSKHAESADAAAIVLPTKLSPALSDKVCTTCHAKQNAHAKAGMSCTTCHQIHTPTVRKTAQVNAFCGSCHANILAKFALPYKHRVLEGAMACTDCHNPHNTQRPANQPLCLNCHGDKRGPFTFEHAPVRLEGCGTCHEAHGSANPRMLIRHEVRLVCLECHANLPNVTNAKTPAIGVVPPAFHDLRSPRFRNCTVCHQKVHGSYADRSLLR